MTQCFYSQCECHINISQGIRTRAKEMVKQFDFAEFMEASAKDGHEVEAVFEKIVSLVSQDRIVYSIVNNYGLFLVLSI